MTHALRDTAADSREATRLAALDDLHIMDTSPEERFDRITRLARDLFGVPIAAINFIDQDRLFTKSPAFPGHAASRDRVDSHCDLTVRLGETLVVPDVTTDERFSARPPVTGLENFPFYAGRPLRQSGQTVGTLCLFDRVPRELDDAQRRLLDDLGEWVERELRDNTEMDRAVEVQRSLLPTTRPAWPAFEVAAIFKPARPVGGDFYAWREVDGAIELTVADVMGKGTAAAILAATVRATFQARTFADGADSTYGVGDDEFAGAEGAEGTDAAEGAAAYDVAETVWAVNEQLAADLGATNSFATLLHARIDVASGRMDYADAGHGLSLIVRADGVTVERLEATGLPIGITAGCRWGVRSVVLGYGDTLISFTDGMLDLFDGTLDSLVLVADLVRAASGPAEIADRTAEIARLADAGDDVTLVAIRRT